MEDEVEHEEDVITTLDSENQDGGDEDVHQTQENPGREGDDVEFVDGLRQVLVSVIGGFRCQGLHFDGS